MADRTGIEWTDASWNPIVGCSLASPGCTNCYAMRQASRIALMAAGAGQVSHYEGTTQPSKAGPVWTGEMKLAPEHILTQPLRWQKPRRIFVNSMGDLFHESVHDEWIDRVFAVMALCPQHTFQVLTKRSARMRGYMSELEALASRRRAFGEIYREIGNSKELWLPAYPLPNVWLGVSTEDQRRADERVPDLLATPAAIRFVSAEPLLGLVDIRRWIPTCYECGASCGLRLPSHPDIERCTECGEECGPDTEPLFSEGCPKCSGELEPVCPECGHYMVYQHPDTPNIDLVIVGGESGSNARPMLPQWARSLRDQCAAAGTAFFFKQWGEHILIPAADGSETWPAPWFGDKPPRKGEVARIERVGKRAAGRLLDGVEHNAMPEVRHG